MNYMFQLDVYRTGRPLDFSVGKHDPLIESSLNENNGIGEPVITVWRLANGTIVKSDGNLVIDWNVDGVASANVQLNLNNFPQEPNTKNDETLRDFNDWDNLVFNFRGTPAFGSGAQEDSHQELTLEEIETMREEAKTIIEISSPETSEQTQDLPTEMLVVVIVMIGIIIFVVYMIMLRKKKKSNLESNEK